MNNPSPLIQQGWLRAAIFILVFFAGAVGIGWLATGVGDLLVIALGTIFSVVLTVLFLRYVDRRHLLSMGFSWERRDAAIGLCLGIVLPGMGTTILYMHGNVSWNAVAFRADDLFIALVLMVLVALGEEMVFRGYVLRNLLQSMNKWVALIVSAFIFAVAHAGNPGVTSLAAVNLLLGGLLLGLNYIYTRNLWFALMFHFSWNFFQGPVLGYEVSGLPLQSILDPSFTGADWLTGGAFGFEGSIAATMVLLTGIGALYTVFEKKDRL